VGGGESCARSVKKRNNGGNGYYSPWWKRMCKNTFIHIPNIFYDVGVTADLTTDTAEVKQGLCRTCYRSNMYRGGNTSFILLKKLSRHTFLIKKINKFVI